MPRTPTPKTLDELRALDLRVERRDVEFKQQAQTSGEQRKVAMAIAAMANLADGGLVILGVEDGTGNIVGLPDDEISRWEDTDTVLDRINAMIEPSVQLTIHRVERCIVLEVAGFAKTPHLVRRDGRDMHEGDLLVRTRRKAASAKVTRIEDWQDLFDAMFSRALKQAAQTHKEVDQSRYAALSEEREELVRQVQELRTELDGVRAQVERANRTARGATGVLQALVSAADANITKFQLRSQQAEAKANLKAAYTALRSWQLEMDRRPPILEVTGFQPEPGGRYVFQGVDGEIVGAVHRHDREDLIAAGRSVLARAGLAPYVGQDDFLVMAAGRLQPGEVLDVWVLGRDGEPRCLTPVGKGG